MDAGSLTSSFTAVANYDFSTHGFQYTIIATENSMTPGLFYRFKIRARNDLGWGDFSNVLKVGLGPLPA
jgi:hypothetical protein